jgi:hypothetical protein
MYLVKKCPYCHENNQKSWIYTSGYDVDADKQNRTKCVVCGRNLINTALTVDEYSILEGITNEVSLFDAMDDLKQKDPIEFQLKMSQFKTQLQQQESSKQTEEDNTPHCPTCGSTDIQKISGTKRWLSTGLFVLASSDIGKSMCCKKCGYKW